MKNVKNFVKGTAAAILAGLTMMTAAVPAIGAYAAEAPQTAASTAKYKVYKDDMTVKMYGEEWTHDEFEAFWVAVYKSFGADVTIEMVKDYTGSPHSEEWIRTGGPVFFADCWFQLNWYEKNDMMDTSHKYYIGKGWRSSEGWR